MYRVLVINPGSTSTKLAVFEDNKEAAKINIDIPREAVMAAENILDQLPARNEQVKKFLTDNGYKLDDFDMIAARGGMLPPCTGGAYAVNGHMKDVIRYAPLAEHASNLACLMADAVSEGKVPCIIYDPLTVDELNPIAKYTGLPDVKIQSVTHVLNSRRVARTSAQEHGEVFEDNNYIVVHMGGGVSINAYERGKLVDMLCTAMGPMSPERAGGLPTKEVAKICFSGKYTHGEVIDLLTKKGGFYAYFGTSDARDVKKLADEGDKLAQDVIAAFNYQITKGIGEMYAAMGCDVAAIVYTGGMAHNEAFVAPSADKVRKMARIDIYPGEEEMAALAQGALRVLQGKEQAKEFTALPVKFKTREEFDAFLREKKK